MKNLLPSLEGPHSLVIRDCKVTITRSWFRSLVVNFDGRNFKVVHQFVLYHSLTCV